MLQNRARLELERAFLNTILFDVLFLRSPSRVR